ncbi:MAG: ComEC family competence protein [Chitinophagaceae bacterium]|nr:ComEC family competence protein [Chitinophagaceae bacterium]
MPVWIPIWKKAPFLRLLVPVIAGIILQWYLQFSLLQIIFAATCFIAAYFAFLLLPLSARFKLQAVQGFMINLILAVLGLFVVYQKDIRHQKNWFGNTYSDSDCLVLKINEPLLQKAKSFKVTAAIENIISDEHTKNCKGNVVLYFANDSHAINLQYGDRIVINKKLQLIKNSGNPGAFDYERYSAFQNVFHTVFLKKGDWILLSDKNINYFKQFLFNTRANILDILRQNMGANDDQLSIAEALLIGYTQDLDKDLVQAYSNTGVVHIIAISGLHLGLIYIMLVWIFARIPFIKKSKILKVIFTLTCLWLFSLLTGGAASVLRSAVMFTCIVIGENFARRSSIFNSLAASAFILLCYNPYFLWDVGFQLSYLAVAGIVIFQKPVYNWFYLKNKMADKIWKLAAVSLAAQIFTFPVCLFYFHQFPNTFLLTNLIMVPLSSLILFIEIFLVAFAWIPFVATFIGKVTWHLVWLMNRIILFFNNLPYALWKGFSATLTSTIILYIIIISFASWLMIKNRYAFKIALFSLFAFTFLSASSKWKSANQQKLIVYNVPQHQAIDFVKGNDYKFVGDTDLSAESPLKNFHLKPARIDLQLNKLPNSMSTFSESGKFYQFKNKTILVIDATISFDMTPKKMPIDVIILSKNAKILISKISAIFNCDKYIFDASNSLWKIANWTKECEQLHLRFFSVPAQGAYIEDL